MDLNEVSIFICVVQAGSFTQAAKKLGMPNSTVSQKVSSLEKRLGTTLIQRTTRKLNVTPAGQAFFKKCILGIEEIKAAEEEIAATQGEPQGLLRVTAPVELGASVLADVISQYMSKYPKVRVEVILSDRRVDLLSESVDLAIRAGELKDSTLIARKIGSGCFIPLAAPKYLKAHGTPAHPRELSSHQCLQFTPVGTEEWKLVGPKGSLNVGLPGKVMVNDLSAIRRMALLGDGIAMLPTHFVVNEVKAGKLVRILPEWRSVLSPLHFVYPAQKFVTSKLSAFMDLAMEPLRKSFEGLEL